MLKKKNVFENLWLIIAVFLVVIACVYKFFNITSENYLMDFASYFSAIFGVIYVVLIARQEKVAYIFGILNVILYAIVSFDKTLYLSATYNIVYSLPVLIYGYINWSKLDGKKDNGVKKFSLGKRIIGIILIVIKANRIIIRGNIEISLR